jgi:hypothetical protein
MSETGPNRQTDTSDAANTRANNQSLDQHPCCLATVTTKSPSVGRKQGQAEARAEYAWARGNTDESRRKLLPWEQNAWANHQRTAARPFTDARSNVIGRSKTIGEPTSQMVHNDRHPRVRSYRKTAKALVDVGPKLWQTQCSTYRKWAD